MTDGTYQWGAWVEAVGPAVINMRIAWLKTPERRFRINKTADDSFHRDFFFDSHSGLLGDFPGGDYELLLSEGSKARLRFSFEEPQFAPYPVISSLTDNQENVGLPLTVSWDNVGDFDYGITIWKESSWEIIIQEWWYSETVTSFTVPDGTLEPNTWYVVEIGVRNPEGFTPHSFYQVRFKIRAD
jgi:hypothetical protein